MHQNCPTEIATIDLFWADFRLLPCSWTMTNSFRAGNIAISLWPGWWWSCFLLLTCSALPLPLSTLPWRPSTKTPSKRRRWARRRPNRRPASRSMRGWAQKGGRQQPDHCNQASCQSREPWPGPQTRMQTATAGARERCVWGPRLHTETGCTPPGRQRRQRTRWRGGSRWWVHYKRRSSVQIEPKEKKEGRREGGKKTHSWYVICGWDEKPETNDAMT